MNAQTVSQPVIGIVGGIGSGKSLVARMLTEQGCRIVDADVIGHELLTRPGVIASLTDRFGSEILTPAGSISRAALGEVVFGDHGCLDDLNAVVHPLLRAELVDRIAKIRAEESFAGPIVLDAALLLDTDWHDLCDVIVFVEAPLNMRRSRVAAERCWDEAELASRENSQKSLDFKRSRAHHTVRNNSSVSHLRQQVRLFYQRLTESKDFFPDCSGL